MSNTFESEANGAAKQETVTFNEANKQHWMKLGNSRESKIQIRSRKNPTGKNEENYTAVSNDYTIGNRQ